MTSCGPHRRADRGCAGITRGAGRNPDEAAAPIVEPACVDRPRYLRHHRGSLGRDGRDAPYRPAARFGEQSRIANRLPERGGGFALDHLRSTEALQQPLQFAEAIVDRDRETLNADERARAFAVQLGRQVRRARDLEGRAERQRERLDGAGVIEAAKHEGGDALGAGQHLEDDLGEKTERAPGAAHALYKIETGNVLHHPSTVLDDLASSIDEAYADKAVARRARHDMARAGEVRGRDRADGRLAG